MHLGNAQRLMQMALHRRAMAPSATPDPVIVPTDETFVPRDPNALVAWDDPCIQCGGVAITRHTDMVTGAVTHWCGADYDHWWMYRTYLPQLRAGEIHEVSDLFVPNYNDQLTGWPD